MELIIHRINKIKELNKIPVKFGCEIDIRAQGSKLILNHDPFRKGDFFEDYLNEYQHGTLVLNIKESGIEEEVLSLVNHYSVKNFFLLDVEFPFIYKSLATKQKNIALRFSFMEPIENIIQFKDNFDWVWVDVYNGLPINDKNVKILSYFKTSLVCPSRWGNASSIDKIKNQMKNLNFNIDAVMTDLNLVNKWIK